MALHNSSDLQAFNKWQQSLEPQTPERLGDALCSAAEEGRIDRVQWLAAHSGVDINYRDGYAIRYALDKGHMSIVNFLLESGANANSFQGSLVTASIKNGNIDLLKKLSDHGADLHYQDEKPLMLSAAWGNVEAIEFLLEQGADVWTKSGEAFTCAQDNGMIEAWNALVHWSKKIDALEDKMDARHVDYNGRKLRDLRKLKKDFNENRIIAAAKGNKFSAVIKVALEAKNDRLRRSDLLMTDQFGNTVLEILGAHNRLASIFHDKIWAGRIDSLKEIWNEHIPERYKDQVNYQNVIEKIKQRTNRYQLRDQSQRSSLKLKRR